MFPNNCPVVEETADGISVGLCWFYIGEEKTCPRHGKINEIENNENKMKVTINLTEEEVKNIRRVVLDLAPDKSIKKLAKMTDNDLINLLVEMSRKEIIRSLMMSRPIL